MAGDFDPDKTIAILDKYFSSWQPGADVKQPTFAPLPALTQPKDTTIVGPEAERVWVAWRAEQANSLQADTLNLLSSVLSNGRAGLFDLDLNQTMKVQGAAGGTELLRDHGAFLLLGTPNQGQSLEEVRSLMLAEIDKLKKGDFPDNLLPSIINNYKRNRYQVLESNEGRADMFVDAFINEVDWKQEVESIDRVSKITKQDIVAFANKFFTDGYVTVYKAQGVDSLQKKIDKPAITPIPTNRDMMSQFVKDIQDSKVEPIQPKFVDYQKDLTLGSVNKTLPLVYKQNTDNDLFNLVFRYDFGKQDDNRYDIAADYLDYVGTDKYTAAQVKQEFYKMACNYSVNVNTDNLTVSLSGLQSQMPKALKLLEELLHHAKADKTSYDQFVGLVLKNRDDGKKDQRTNFSYLLNYATYGPHNTNRDVMTADELRQADPQQLLGLLANLSNLKHTVLYYGKLTPDELSKVLTATHKTAKTLADVPKGKPYERQQAATNEVFIAPYDAKNIYLVMYNNEGRDWNPDKEAVVDLFNEYYGGGMNGIVFQEMREARGLAYSAAAYYVTPSIKGEKEFSQAYIITQNDKMMDAVNQFHVILNEMPASENAFRIAKDAVTKQLASQRVTKFSVISDYLMAKRRGIDYDINEKVYNALPALTLQDIVDFEKQVMANKQYRYIILGDEKELDMKALEQLGPIRRLTTEEIFGY
jgi:predicted Zn-dependent peptidase